MEIGALWDFIMAENVKRLTSGLNAMCISVCDVLGVYLIILFSPSGSILI